MTEPANMDCIELVELVTGYLEGALPGDDRARFEHHLGKCRGCRAYVDQLEVTVRLTGRLRESDLEPSMRERLLEAFRGWSPAPES